MLPIAICRAVLFLFVFKEIHLVVEVEDLCGWVIIDKPFILFFKAAECIVIFSNLSNYESAQVLGE